MESLIKIIIIVSMIMIPLVAYLLCCADACDYTSKYADEYTDGYTDGDVGDLTTV